jgi:hypothetical protein
LLEFHTNSLSLEGTVKCGKVMERNEKAKNKQTNNKMQDAVV